MQHLASWALESAFRSRWATCERSPSGELGDPRASISSCVKRAQLVLPCGSWREAGRSPQGCGERAQGPAAQSGSARGRDRPRLKHTPRGLGRVLGILLLRGWERRKGGAGASGPESQFSSQDRNSAARPEGSRPDVGDGTAALSPRGGGAVWCPHGAWARQNPGVKAGQGGVRAPNGGRWCVWSLQVPRWMGQKRLRPRLRFPRRAARTAIL